MVWVMGQDAFGGGPVLVFFVFHSAAERLAGADSDVDLLADLPPGMGLLGLGRVQAELEAILGARVDLVPASDLKPAVRARVEPDLVAL